ncbi:MarP family serine protease [Paenarthrobacter sp. DKR-5]|uniref:MarP family serine protease n=1 Tax=Paenarthrobacter sp. DKR-5 TaxID=2835535 RepID=UPI001BDD4080|nr:MarP family serine protease [Paenarthrobacter sp. DKR-5]MBT1001351.1 MarP family serine protease [Paenarthrobacter sp. DKR-5]
MFGFTILDFILVLVLLSYLFYGLRSGFLVSLGGIAGFIAGAVAAFLSVPMVSSAVQDSNWRLTAVIAVAVVLVAVGHALGTMLGRAIRRVLPFQPLRALDRALGGVVNVVVAALVLSALAFSVSTMGVPGVSTAIADSKVIRTIDSGTPTALKAMIAQLRSSVMGDGIPKLLDGLHSSQPASIPNASTDTPALNQAAKSVLKITGTAYQCGQNQTGTGFVVSPGRVLTNAHVVAGVSQPVVELQGGGALSSRVVYFDSKQDLAVLAVDGLTVPALPLGEQLKAGSQAAFAGYPHGGPFTSKPAAVQGVTTALVPDIYGQNPSPEKIYEIAGDVQPGNSGGPLLNTSGQVAGVVFAKATDNSTVGYAFTPSELDPVAAEAPSLSRMVSSGSCTKK